jgi:hypothetical protein
MTKAIVEKKMLAILAVPEQDASSFSEENSFWMRYLENPPSEKISAKETMVEMLATTPKISGAIKRAKIMFITGAMILAKASDKVVHLKDLFAFTVFDTFSVVLSMAVIVASLHVLP